MLVGHPVPGQHDHLGLGTHLGENPAERGIDGDIDVLDRIPVTRTASGSCPG